MAKDNEAPVRGGAGGGASGGKGDASRHQHTIPVRRLTTPPAIVDFGPVTCGRSRCPCQATARKGGPGAVHCPNHPDDRPSLGILKGGVVGRCFAGCGSAAALAGARGRGRRASPQGDGEATPCQIQVSPPSPRFLGGITENFPATGGGREIRRLISPRATPGDMATPSPCPSSPRRRGWTWPSSAPSAGRSGPAGWPSPIWTGRGRCSPSVTGWRWRAQPSSCGGGVTARPSTAFPTFAGPWGRGTSSSAKARRTLRPSTRSVSPPWPSLAPPPSRPA